MNKPYQKFAKFYFKVFPYIIAFCIAFVSGIVLYCLSFYIHEGGHIADGFFDNLISKGIVAKFEISNWIECPILKVLKLPQQTRITYGYTSMNYAFGGIILTILVFSFFSYYYFKSSKNKYKWAVFLFPILFIIHEIFGNFLCGTDNLNGNLYPLCASSIFINYMIKSIPYLLIIPFFILLIEPLQKGTAIWLSKLDKRHKS